MAIGSRMLFMLILATSSTGCLNVGAHDIRYGTSLPLAATSIASSSQALLFSQVAIVQLTSDNSVAGNSSLFLPLPAGSGVSSSSVRLSVNADGSVSVHANGGSVSPLRGLDPSLVNSDLLPFIFPSCEVPAVLLGVTR